MAWPNLASKNWACACDELRVAVSDITLGMPLLADYFLSWQAPREWAVHVDSEVVVVSGGEPTFATVFANTFGRRLLSDGLATCSSSGHEFSGRLN